MGDVVGLMVAAAALPAQGDVGSLLDRSIDASPGDTLNEMRRGSGAIGESELKLWLYPEP